MERQAFRYFRAIEFYYSHYKYTLYPRPSDTPLSEGQTKAKQSPYLGSTAESGEGIRICFGGNSETSSQ